MLQSHVQINRKSLMGRRTYHAIKTPFCLHTGVVTRILLSQSKYNTKTNDDRHRWLGRDGGGEGQIQRLVCQEVKAVSEAPRYICTVAVFLP